MPRGFIGMIVLTFAVLLAAAPATAYADQWTAERVHSAVMTANRNAHYQAERPGGTVSAAQAPPLQTGGRRTRTEHLALDRQANQLSNQMTR
jgi:hypothetical protein